MGFTQRVTRSGEHGRDREPGRPALPTVPPDHMRSSDQSIPGRCSAVSRPRSLAKLVPGSNDFEAGHPRHVPETWPTLLSRNQLCAYIGVGAETITRICPVRPLDLGANLVRDSRRQIDDWVATLPPRLMVAQHVRGDPAEAPSVQEEEVENRAEAALERVRARADGAKWRRTA